MSKFMMSRRGTWEIQISRNQRHVGNSLNDQIKKRETKVSIAWIHSFISHVKHETFLHVKFQNIQKGCVGDSVFRESSSSRLLHGQLAQHTNSWKLEFQLHDPIILFIYLFWTEEAPYFCRYCLFTIGPFQRWISLTTWNGQEMITNSLSLHAASPWFLTPKLLTRVQEGGNLCNLPLPYKNSKVPPLDLKVILQLISFPTQSTWRPRRHFQTPPIPPI